MVRPVSADIPSQIPCSTKPISCAPRVGDTITSPLAYSPGLKRGSCVFIFVDRALRERKMPKGLQNNKIKTVQVVGVEVASWDAGG